MKKQFGFRETRLRGMAKNHSQVNVLPAPTNLLLPKRQLLAMT